MKSEGILKFFIPKEKTIDIGKQFLQGNAKALLMEEALNTFTDLIYKIYHFLQYKN